MRVCGSGADRRSSACSRAAALAGQDDRDPGERQCAAEDHAQVQDVIESGKLDEVNRTEIVGTADASFKLLTAEAFFAWEGKAA